MTIRVSDLSQIGEERLQRAVRAVIEGQGLLPEERRSLPGPEQFRAGAEAIRRDSDEAESKYFQSILELGYLVASADGFAPQERQALAALLEQATGAAVNRGELEVHLKDLEDGCAMLGRRERLRRAAADFDDQLGRREAIGFTALVAVADGMLADAELEALRELGSCFEFGMEAVDEIVMAIARDIDRALESEVAS
jgi:tellurite resistance protein